VRRITDVDLDLLAVAYKLAGAEGYAVLETIIKERECTDEELSDTFKVKPNVIRQIIYNLERNDLVTFRKTIDLKTNWVTFYWRANKNYFKNYVYYKRAKILERNRKRYEYEKSHGFFTCPNKCTRITFDDAYDAGFRCPICNEVLSMEDNSKLVEFLGNVLSNALKPSPEHRPASRNKHR
jgi:transcription initiation factor TFIIE subunit alpha